MRMEPNHYPALPYRTPGGPDRANLSANHRPDVQRIHFDAPPLILTGRPNFWSLWAAFRRRWRLAVGLGLILCIIAAVSGWYFTTSMTYTAVAVLRVESEPQY